MAAPAPSPAPRPPAAGAPCSLADWAAARSDDFRVIAEKRGTDAKATVRALELVRRFIADRKLILYGGTAIDYALRLRGGHIYPDHLLPDYDFYSPNSVDDAYDLVDLLDREGFPQAGALPAFHVQTMRVKFDFIFVADISYAPRAIFDRLPTFDYCGLRVLHPDHQRIDMHLAFCFPFNNPPREDVFNRFRKDLGRLNMFMDRYPIASGAPLPAAGRPPLPVAAAVDLDLVALHGFAAYAFNRQALFELAAAARLAGVDPPPACARGLAAPALPVSVAVSGAPRSRAWRNSGRPARVEVTPPAGLPPRLVFATPHPPLVVNALTASTGVAARWFDPVMDARPTMGLVPVGPGGGAVEVYSTERRLLAIYKIQASPCDALVSVVSPQYLLLDLLFRAHQSEGAERNIYLAFYGHTLDILAAGEAIINALRAPRSEGGPPAVPDNVYRRFVLAGPFGFPVSTIGEANLNISYLARRARSARVLQDPPPLGYDSSGLPSAYYAGPAGKARPKFDDYEANEAYRRAGAPRRGPLV